MNERMNEEKKTCSSVPFIIFCHPFPFHSFFIFFKSNFVLNSLLTCISYVYLVLIFNSDFHSLHMLCTHTNKHLFPYYLSPKTQSNYLTVRVSQLILMEYLITTKHTSST